MHVSGRATGQLFSPLDNFVVREQKENRNLGENPWHHAHTFLYPSSSQAPKSRRTTTNWPR